MGGLPVGNGIVVVLLALGLLGGVLLLVGRRAWLRWLVAVGVLMAIAGYGMFGMALCGVVSQVYLSAAERRLVQGSFSSSGALEWHEVQQALDDAALGVLSVTKYNELLRLQITGMSTTMPGGSMVSLVWDRMHAGKLPAKYMNATIDWLIEVWPSWKAGANQGDEIPGLLLASPGLSTGARDKIVDFMLKELAAGAWQASYTWFEELDRLALGGKLDRARLTAYVAGLANPELALESCDPEFWRGDLVSCSLRNATGGLIQVGSKLPWRATIRLRETNMACIGSAIELPFFAFDRSSELGKVLLPETPGKHEVMVELEAVLGREQVREYFMWNPGQRPAGFNLADVPEVRIQRQIALPVSVVNKQAAAPKPVGDEEMGARIRACITNDSYAPIDVRRDGSGRCAGRLVFVKPPVGLAMDVIWVIDGKERVIDFLVVEAEKTTVVQYGGDVGAYRGGRCALVLRPNLTLIKHPRGLTEVYNGPPITLSSDSYTR